MKIFKTVISAIVHLLALLIKIVYNIFKLLRIRLLALYLIVCGLTELIFRVFHGAYAAVFWAGCVFCVLVTLVSWGSFLRRKLSRKRVAREARTPNDARPSEEVQAEVQEESAQASAPPAQTERVPHYYDVAGAEGYVFAEYEDRYVLYRRTKNGLEYVRTDDKREGDR